MNYPLQTIGLNASTDIESKRFVVTDDASTVAQASGSAKYILGVSGDVKTTTGNVCDITTSGLIEVEFGGTVLKHAPLTSDSQGRAVAATTDDAFIAGYALEAGTEGELRTMDLQKSILVVPA